MFIAHFHFHNKAVLLSLFQTAFFPPLGVYCRCCSFSLHSAINRSQAQVAGADCPRGDAYAALQSPSPADRHDSHPPGVGCAGVNPGLSDSLGALMVPWAPGQGESISGWWSPSGSTSSILGGTERSERLRKVQQNPLFKRRGLFPLEILAVDREPTSVVSFLLNWIIFQGMEPAVWAPWGQPAASAGSTHLRRKRPRRGMFHLNPIISGELQHVKRFVLHRVHSLH